MLITKENIDEFIKGTTMDCSHKGISHIEYIPESITRLHCGYNQLTELPKLPESLTSLYCDNNNLPYQITLDNIKEHNKLIKRKEILEKIRFIH